MTALRALLRFPFVFVGWPLGFVLGGLYRGFLWGYYGCEFSSMVEMLQAQGRRALKETR